MEKNKKEESLKGKMIEEAIAEYEKIYPPEGKKNLNACFTKDKGNLIFQFNTKSCSNLRLVKKIK